MPVYDWGGRGACVAAALWPERVRGLVSITGYNIQNIPNSGRPASAAQGKSLLQCQWLFQNRARSGVGLQERRRDICRLLWQLWSPNWRFDDATFEATARSFDNLDFRSSDDTVVSTPLRQRAGRSGFLEPFEHRLAQQPPITVPTIVLHGACDGVGPAAQSEHHAQHFIAGYERRVVPVAGHFLSRETPDAVVQAVRELAG